MAINPEPRIVFAEAMSLIGLRMTHAMPTLAIEIPKQWQAFRQQFAAAHNGEVTYGICCHANATEMEYMCGVETASLALAPEHAGKIIIPAQKYAVFLHEGRIADIGNSWDQILHQLMPALNLEDAPTPSFERYDQRYNAITGVGAVEIYCPIK